MTVGIWVAIAVLLAATAFGMWRRRTEGHFRSAPRDAAGHSSPGSSRGASRAAGSQDRPPVLPGVDVHLPSAEDSDWAHDGYDDNPHDVVRTRLAGAVRDEEYGERATLVQFSSAFCAPCRVARQVLAEVAAMVPGVTHVEVDAEAHLDVVRAVGVLRTPTTIVVDAAGREVSRATGAPRKEQVLTALSHAT